MFHHPPDSVGLHPGGPDPPHLSKLGLDDKTLLRRRHQFQATPFNRTRSPLEDQDVEDDEMFQNAGGKGTPHPGRTMLRFGVQLLQATVTLRGFGGSP